MTAVQPPQKSRPQRWFKLKTSHKITGFAGAFFCVFVGLHLKSWLNLREANHEVQDAIRIERPLVKTIAELERHHDDYSQVVALMVRSPSQNKGELALLEDVYGSLEVQTTAIQQLALQGEGLAQAAQTATDSRHPLLVLKTDTAEYEAIATLFTQLASEHDQLVRTVNVFVAGKYDPAVGEVPVAAAENLLTPDLVGDVNYIEQAIERNLERIDQIQERLDNNLLQSLAITAKAQEQLQAYSLSLLMLTFGFGAVLTLWILRQLSRSLTKVTEKARWISQNVQANKEDWLSERLTPHELSLAIAAGEDIAELSFAFNQMLESLAESRIQQAAIEEKLAEETQLMSFTLRSIGDGVMTTDKEGIIISANLAAEALLGCGSEKLCGKTLNEIFDKPDEAEQKQWNLSQSQESCWVTFTNYSGEAKIFDVSHAPILGDKNHILGAVVIFRDMTALLNATKELFWQASHDPLTKLANRREFQSQIEGLQQGHHSADSTHSILYLDLDRFKIVNDTCGHDAGDELLRQIARRLEGEIRTGDTLARLGGDEFGIILQHCSVENALVVAQKILGSVQTYRFIWEHHQFSLGISIGAVPYVPSEDNPTLVMKAADAACYEAKNKGRNQIYAVSNKQIHLDGQTREMNWLSTINQALEENRFCLYQQKISGLAPGDEAHVHYEILLRLETAEGKILSPGGFLPIAERYQLMTKIDRWVISNFFESQHAYLRSMVGDRPTEGKLAPPNHNFYSVNLSADSLNDPDLLPFLEAQFTKYQVPPEVICFEVTETVAIANLHRAIEIIQAIKQLGCRFALDDFGSGMSSFGYLQKLPVDFLKIDGLFIRELCENSMNEIIVTALDQVAKAVGIKTIAEFVEDHETMEKLREIGVDYAQGYGIAKPEPLPQLRLVTPHKSPDNKREPNPNPNPNPNPQLSNVKS